MAESAFTDSLFQSLSDHQGALQGLSLVPNQWMALIRMWVMPFCCNDCLILWIESVSLTYWRHSTTLCILIEGTYAYEVLLCTLDNQQKTCVQKDKKSHILSWMCQTRIMCRQLQMLMMGMSIFFFWTVQSTLLSSIDGRQLG